MLLALTLALVPIAQAANRAVFAHYMVGTTTKDHIQQDVDDAIAMGLDGFALNVQCPTDAFAKDLILEMGRYIEAQELQFGILISMDVYASGGASCGSAGAADYVSLCQEAMALEAYYQVDGKYVVSTFTSGGGTWETWNHFKASLSDLGFEVYWIPDLDDTEGYWDSQAGWWDAWGNLTDGLFGWESAWPSLGQQALKQTGGLGGIARDQVIIDAAARQGASYMIPLSLMQYKNSYGTNIYRQGGENLMQRLSNILNIHSNTLQFVEYITWNDGPEGHYLGNLWPEQNGDAALNNYANMTIWPHTGLQPLIHSFATAFRAFRGPSEMRPQNGNEAAGAIWYQTPAFDIPCPFEDIGEPTATFWSKPAGYETFSNTTQWAVVLNETVGGYNPSELALFITTGDGVRVVASNLTAGLNFAQGPDVHGGSDVTMVLAPISGGDILYHASGGKCPDSYCRDGFYNLNYQVLPLVPGHTTTGCTYETSALRYIPWNSANAAVGCQQLLLNASATDSWYLSQAGLALEFETTRHSLSTRRALTSTLPSLDAHFNAFDGVNVTNCANLSDNSSCSIPETCPLGTDHVPYFFAQRSFAIFQRCLRDMASEVFGENLISALEIDNLVNSITRYLTLHNDEAGLDRVKGAVAAGLTVVRSGLGPIDEFASAFATLLGGIFSMASVLGTPTDPTNTSVFLSEPSTALKTRLLAGVQGYNTSLFQFAHAVFVTGNLSSFPGYALDTSNDRFEAYYTTRLPKVFAGGRFADPNMACSNLADELILPIQQVLLGLLLASANVYIVQNGHPVEECASMWGGVVLDLDSDDPVCYTLEIPGSGASNTDISIPLSGNVSDLIYSTYKINQTALVRSSLQCQSTKNRYHVAYIPLPTVIPGCGYSTSSLPSCFFNLPVLYTSYTASMNSSSEGISGTPCQVRGGTPTDGVGHYLPSNLAAVFTGEFCTCASTASESLS